MTERRVRVSDIRHMVKDGQHQHGSEWKTLDVDDEALYLLAAHLRESDCMPRPLTRDSQLPIQFTMNNEMNGDATVICGVCKKVLGTCKVQVRERNAK